MDVAAVSDFLTTWGYPLFLLLLLATGVGSPIPEDFVLLAAGYLVFTGVFGWPVACALGLIGVVVSDLMLYAAGRHLLWRSDTGRNPRLLSERRLDAATRWLDRVGPWGVLIARLVPGTRLVVFITAGVRNMPPLRFVAFDAAGALIWVPAVLLAGSALGPQVGRLSELVALISRSAAWVLVFFALLVLGRLLWGREESKL